ncbi:hypothetical protein HDV64DRAFT_281060 [Trichoderma sp. TUCIM 5745]
MTSKVTRVLDRLRSRRPPATIAATVPVAVVSCDPAWRFMHDPPCRLLGLSRSRNSLMTVALGLKRVQSAATAGFRNDQASPATVHANWMPHPHCGVCGIPGVILS